jgi:hypothetical protein
MGADSTNDAELAFFGKAGRALVGKPLMTILITILLVILAYNAAAVQLLEFRYDHSYISRHMKL